MGFETALGSLTSVPLTSRAETSAAASPDNTKLVEASKVFMTAGTSAQPVIQSATQTSADFYRDGKQSSNATRNAATGGFNVYDILPANIEEHDQKPASIRVYGRPSSSPNKDVDLVPAYSKFFLQNVQEAHNERSQIVETFGDFYAFFFGQKPPVYNYTGTLINTQNENWLQDFMYYYDNFLRGTKCVENNARLILTYGGRQVEGYMLNVSNVTAAETDIGVQFSFQLLILDRKVLGLSDDFGIVLVNGQFSNSSLTALRDSSQADISKVFGTAKDTLTGKKPAASTTPLGAGDAAAISSTYPGISIAASPFGGLTIG